MDGFKLFLLLCFLKCTIADVFSDVMRSRDRCKEICDNTQLPLPSRQICQRGCRFFNLATFKGYNNETKDECHSSCSDAYSRKKDRISCNLGCDSMFKEKKFETSDNWLVIIGQEGHEKFMIMQPELELDNDLLMADPGLRNQIEWSYEYKIPETHIRTMPIGDNTISFGIPYEEEGNSKEKSHHSSDWLDCAARNSGLPRWILAMAIAMAIFLALFLCLAPERFNFDVSQPFLVNDLQFAPPPKYSLSSDKV